MSVTAYIVLTDKTLAGLAAQVNTSIGLGNQPWGVPIQDPEAKYPQSFSQMMIAGTPPGSGAAQAISDITGLQAALDAINATLALKADLVTGHVPIAQLPVATSAAVGVAKFGSGTTITAGNVTVP